MKIVHVVDSMEMGGAEMLIALLCRSQRAEGHLPSIHCLFEAGTLAEELEKENIPVQVHDLGPGLLGKFRLVRSLYRTLANEGPDVVHCHNMLPTILAAPVARMARVGAVFSTRHGLATPYNAPSEVEGIADSRGAFYRFRFAAIFCDRVIAVCEAARRNLTDGPGAFLNKVSTIRNGTSSTPLSSAPDLSIKKEGFTLVSVARLNWKKDHASLLHAVALVQHKVPDLVLWLIGDGTERASLQKLALQLGIDARVRFLGERRDVGDWLAQADLFVLSSLTEGLPVSLLEAMAAGLPFLVTNVGAMPEIAGLSGGGFIVTANRPKALAEGIIQSANRRRELPELGRRALKCYQQYFTPDAMLRGYSRLYQETLSKTKRRERPAGNELRVLHIALSLARGGRRKAIESLVRGSRELGVESALCCLGELECPQEDIEKLGTSLLTLRRRHLFDWAAFKKLREFCREMRVDIVHAHDEASQFAAALALLGNKRTPLLMTHHRTLDIESITTWDHLRNAFAGLQCGAVITGSRDRRSHFLDRTFIPARKVVHIPFGTELSLFHPDLESREDVRREFGFGSDVVVLGTVGHFGPEKGVDVAIRAFHVLAQRSLPQPVALVIFGEGERRAFLEKLAAEACAPVRFMGFRDDMHRYMNGFDILLHSPRQEAFGLVIIEAMASGVPVVASRIGGIPDLVREGRTGYLAESENPDSFADAIERLLRNPGTMGQEARRVGLAEYGCELSARRYLKVYEKLLGHRAAPRSDVLRTADESRCEAESCTDGSGALELKLKSVSNRDRQAAVLARIIQPQQE